MIQYALVDFGTLDNPVSTVRGSPPLARYGFATFGYGNYFEPLQQLTWQKNFLVPSFPGADSLQIFTFPAATYTVALNGNPGQGLGVQTVQGAINIGQAIFAGVHKSIAGNFDGSLLRFTGTPELPFPTSATDKLSKLYLMTDWYASLQGTLNKMNPLLIALAFASEIAQATVLQNMAETTQDVPNFTGSNLIMPTSGVVRSAFLGAISVPKSKVYEYGNYGASKLGYYAWDYNDFKTPAKCVNTQQFVSFPPIPGATGFYVITMPNITMNGQIGVNEFTATAMQTFLGQINLGANILTGLSP